MNINERFSKEIEIIKNYQTEIPELKNIVNEKCSGELQH